MKMRKNIEILWNLWTGPRISLIQSFQMSTKVPFFLLRWDRDWGHGRVCDDRDKRGRRSPGPPPPLRLGSTEEEEEATKTPTSASANPCVR